MQDEPSISAIAEKLADPGKRELLRFLNEQVLREQEIYWQRFYSFATLHAGAFVLMTSVSVAPSRVAEAGLVLGIAWAHVQWASLHYANRAKKLYHQIREDLGLMWDTKSVFGKLFGRQPWASSTNVGLGVAWFVLAVWIFIVKHTH